MILIKSQIAERIADGRICISPYDPERLNPNSYDVTLGNDFIMYTGCIIDPEEDNPYQVLRFEDGDKFLFPAGAFLLGCVAETITTTCNDIVPMLHGKSSLARYSLEVHRTAGFGDVGFNGRWTLEFTTQIAIWLRPGMKIAQIAWETCEPSSDLYRGHYNNDSIAPSRYHEVLL